MLEKDTFKTIGAESSEAIFKDRGSKFIGVAYPIKSEENVKLIIDRLRSEHPKARHWCYAWQLGTETIRYKMNDDGEPSNSAGRPIFGQILSKELTDILVVVVRYFGGTKLGVGGLVNAYKTTAQMALDTSKIVTKTIKSHYLLNFDYPYMDLVMRIIKEKKINITKQKLDLNCEFEISVRNKKAEEVRLAFEALRHVKIKEV